MKITKQRLKEIIKEEIAALSENDDKVSKKISYLMDKEDMPHKQAVAAALGNAFGAKGAAHAPALDGDRGFLQADHFEAGPQQFPGHAAQRPGEYLREGVDLLLGGRGFDHENAFAIAFVNGLGPIDNGRALEPVHAHVANDTGIDIQPHQCPATAVLRIGKAAKITTTSKIAITKFVAAAFH